MKINFYYHIDKATGEKHTQKIVPQTGNHVSYFLAKLHPLMSYVSYFLAKLHPLSYVSSMEHLYLYSCS